MKRIIFALAAAMICLAATAQEQASRTMRIFHGGQVVYMRDVAQMDSINFLLNVGEGGDEGTEDTVGSGASSIWIGVVAFNRDIYQLPITNNLEAAKTFIDLRDNNQDFTAFAYAVSKGNLLFDAEDLPEFDKIFMLNFSDGTDNYSNSKWGTEGRRVGANYVYDTARYDLLQRAGLNSYALGFGEAEGDFREKMQKVVMGSGSYEPASSAKDLQPTFEKIANAMIASAQNVTLLTMPGFYDEEMGYKYFRFTFTATNEAKFLRDTIYARLEGENATGYTLSITQEGKYARFDAPVEGNLDTKTNKVIMPLNNLKFIVDEDDIPFEFGVEVSFDAENYYADVEDASTAEAVGKRLAVVLVLDCSTSMGDAFKPMKDAAIKFIETLELMAGMQGGSGSQGGGSSRPMADYTEDLGEGISFNMKPVKGGAFLMGAQSAGAALPNYDSDAQDAEQPVHKVELSDFFIGETEVTQGLWEYVMGAHNTSHYPSGAETVYLYPAFNSSGSLVATGGTKMYGETTPSSSYGVGKDYPVYYVSYNDIVGEHGFLDRLNALTGKKYRLPTEAEWEYAARGGQSNRYTSETLDPQGKPSDGTLYKYAGSNAISNVAWYYSNSGSKTHPVAQKEPNELGLYDMSGNVYEWCLDWYGSYSSSAATNPTGPYAGSSRVLRGGGWGSDAGGCRVSNRSFDSPDNRDYYLGFRVVVLP